MRTPPGKSIAITFHSHQTKKLEMRWRAILSFPPDAGSEATVDITVLDGLNAPVKAGSLELAGLLINVKDGKAAISFGDFVKGKHEKAIWLHRKGMLPIPGALTFA